MRLGDLDALKAQLNKLPMMSNWGEAFMPLLIDEQPTIDAVPVVRCRECKHKNTTACPAYDAPFMRTSLRIKFCSEGQRKEADHEDS